MRDSIYTIPISEVFEPKCGCPICSLQTTLENRCIDYILGAAMMEPDVRIETNKYGFCSTHYTIMQEKNNKLSLALMLESHLQELGKKKPDLKQKKDIEVDCSCFVCKEINEVIKRLAANAINMYANDLEFRKLFCEQSYFCYPHYKLLCDVGSKTLNKKAVSGFIEDITDITKRQLDIVLTNVHDFTLMFDYRNATKEKTPEMTSAVENAIKFLVGNSNLT